MVQPTSYFQKKSWKHQMFYTIYISKVFLRLQIVINILWWVFQKRLQIPWLSEDRILFFWGIKIKQKQITSYTHNVKTVFVKLLSHVWLFCDPMDCSQLGASFRGISPQTRILKWVAIAFSRGSTWCGI